MEHDNFVNNKKNKTRNYLNPQTNYFIIDLRQLSEHHKCYKPNTVNRTVMVGAIDSGLSQLTQIIKKNNIKSL